MPNKINFHDLFSSINDSVIKANEVVQKQHLELLKEFFNIFRKKSPSSIV